MRISYLAFISLAGCGGAAFEGPLGAPSDTAGLADDAGAGGVVDAPTTPLDAALAADAPAPPRDAGFADTTWDAPAELQDAPAPPLDAPVVCSPVAWKAPLDGSTQGPFKNCSVNADSSTYLPAFYAVVTTKAAGCFLERTPLACQCETTYTCACLLGSTSLFCSGAALLGCDDSLGAPIITCQ
jgi:hypothetical protein